MSPDRNLVLTRSRSGRTSQEPSPEPPSPTWTPAPPTMSMFGPTATQKRIQRRFCQGPLPPSPLRTPWTGVVTQHFFPFIICERQNLPKIFVLRNDNSAEHRLDLPTFQIKSFDDLSSRTVVRNFRKYNCSSDYNCDITAWRLLPSPVRTAFRSASRLPDPSRA